MINGVCGKKVLVEYRFAMNFDLNFIFKII